MLPTDVPPLACNRLPRIATACVTGKGKAFWNSNKVVHKPLCGPHLVSASSSNLLQWQKSAGLSWPVRGGQPPSERLPAEATMAPVQSAEELGQQCQAMRAGEDEEGGRGSGHLRQLPAAAGKVAGPGTSCRWSAAHVQLAGLQEDTAKPVDWGTHRSSS